MSFNRAFFYPFNSNELPEASARSISGLLDWDGFSVYEFQWLKEYKFGGETFVELGFEPKPGKSVGLQVENLNCVAYFVDAAFAVHNDFKSHTGGVMTMGRGEIASISRKQKMNTRSSTVAELVTADDVIGLIL